MIYSGAWWLLVNPLNRDWLRCRLGCSWEEEEEEESGVERNRGGSQGCYLLIIHPLIGRCCKKTTKTYTSNLDFLKVCSLTELPISRS
jgi:hypothetical protein